MLAHRLLLAIAITTATAAAADPAPPQAPTGAQKLVEESIAVVGKARQAFDAATRKEQEKLVAALAKEQEKETRKGNLDGALAIKALITDVQAGLLLAKTEDAADLMGDGAGKAPPPGTVPANLTTDCPLLPVANRMDGAPKSIETMLTKATGMAIPRGDRNRYIFTVVAAGTVAIQTGGWQGNYGELWDELEKSGFKRVEAADQRPWFVLEARAGAKFTAFDQPGGVPVTIYAGRIRTAK